MKLSLTFSIHCYRISPRSKCTWHFVFRPLSLLLETKRRTIQDRGKMIGSINGSINYPGHVALNRSFVVLCGFLSPWNGAS